MGGEGHKAPLNKNSSSFLKEDLLSPLRSLSDDCTLL